MGAIRGGLYEHYKGNKYVVIEIVRGSEDLKYYVMYKQMPNDFDDEETLKKDSWIRPLEMWEEEVEINGTKTPRFKLICVLR